MHTTLNRLLAPSFSSLAWKRVSLPLDDNVMRQTQFGKISWLLTICHKMHPYGGQHIYMEMPCICIYRTPFATCNVHSSKVLGVVSAQYTRL